MAAGKINLQANDGAVVGLVIPDGLGSGERQIALKDDINTIGIALKTIATGTATFTSTTNNINLTGLGLGVEVGDVIQITGAEDVKNNSEFTIEVITDANNIIVNQAHSNKGTTKNVANRASDTGVTVKLLSKWYNAPIGLGQGWVNVVRNVSTIYLNNTNRTIKIHISITSTTAVSGDLFVSEFAIDEQYYNYGSGNRMSLKSEIPKGSNYRCSASGTGLVIACGELR